MRKLSYFVSLIILVSCIEQPDYSKIEGVWYTPFNREIYPFDTVTIEDDFGENAYTAYTLATDTGLIKHIYSSDTLQSVTRKDMVEIVEFRYKIENEGIMLQYSYFPDVGHIESDRDLAIKSSFKINNATGEIYLMDYENSDTMQLQVLSDDQLQIDNTTWERYDVK